MLKKICFACLFLSWFWVNKTAYAQKEANIWYFGERAGLDFTSGKPVPLANSMLSTMEGCATISNTDGNLLFYTNGVSVWNREHKLMPNGNRLMGHRSSTQSAVIVPRPLNPNIYYIFTADLQSQLYGLRYSEVDMKLQNGMGDIAKKNNFLISPVSEKLTAVKHSNNKDYWVITHKWNSDGFYAYQVTAAGVSRQPIVSNVGTTHKGKNKEAIGAMKVSPDGKKLALALWRDSNKFEVFDFNASTGKVSNPISFDHYDEAYGVEFSPDGTKLYGTTNGIGNVPSQIWQFNLLGSRQAVEESPTLIAVSKADKIGSLQLGPDGKIYLAKEKETTLGLINNPNAPGLGCNYVDEGQMLDSASHSELGLPNFVQSFFFNIRYSQLR
ncbi:PD40 domain-containing protein [Adhaeribacter radiodurans]|uniref:PD40 domain-containing protein n=1 Tax=Adhaeribacter radiodurans TaxID=2745197 RepID=A0A7L7L7V3_9BACT|nr:PD40 domain-containing protein [Adhaeribacter radiodurans]